MSLEQDFARAAIDWLAGDAARLAPNTTGKSGWNR